MLVLDDVLGPRRPDRIDVFVPDATAIGPALRRTTVLGIGAHPDDLELGGAWGVVTCAGRPDRWFTGVTCTDGAGSPRRTSSAAVDAAELVARRRDEQRAAAQVGGYGLQVQLGHSSVEVRDPTSREALTQELAVLIDAARPSVVLSHDLLDRHTTHAAVGLAAIAACRSLPLDARPERLLAVEGWRSLDWLTAADQVRLDVSGHDDLLQQLLDCFPSQLEGKRYDRGGVGRRQGNATFDDASAFDVAEQIALAVDLTPLLTDDVLTIDAFIGDLLDRAHHESLARLRSVLGPLR